MDTKKIIRIISIIAALLGGGGGYDIMTGETPTEPAREEQSAEAQSAAKVEKTAPAATEKKPIVIRVPEDGYTKTRSDPSVQIKVSKGAEKQSAAKPSARKRCIFASFRDGEWVTGWGTVKKLLPDDTVPPCHQRFLLVDPTGETLLVASNIDRWPRLADLHAGDIVEFKGEFKDTENGYLVHWTHPDTSGRRPGGYIRKAR